MPLKIACQMDPIERIDIAGDSTFAMLLEAQKRGHEIFYYTPDKLSLDGARLMARGHRLTVRDKAGDHATLSNPRTVDLSEWERPTAPLQATEPLVVGWGRVQYEKGFQVLARAVGALRQRVPGIRCVIAGRGSYLAELQTQIDVEGLSDIVNLAGFVPDADLRKMLHGARCSVIPSLYEPFGIVALESMAAGAPTIVARTGGLAEIVEGTGAGLLFEPGNHHQLADRIDEVLTRPDLADGLQRAAADLLATHYTWDAIAKSTLSVYTEAVSQME